jgi:hypothetical protein
LNTSKSKNQLQQQSPVHNSGYKQKACHNFCIAPGQFYRETKLFSILLVSETMLAKIAPWCLASRDSLLAKEPRSVTGWTAPPTLSAHTRKRYS